MGTDEAVECVELTFRSMTLRQRLVDTLRGSYADSVKRAADHAPWSLARWGVPHDRRGVVEGRLFDLARELPEARPVLIDNRRHSHTFLGMQLGQILMVPARTGKPQSLPRRADVRCRLAQSPQLSFFETQTIGYDPTAGDPLLVILGHGPAKGMPALLGWARLLVPDHRYRIAVHTIDLLLQNDDHVRGDQPGAPEIPPVLPRLRRRDDNKNKDVGA